MITDLDQLAKTIIKENEYLTLATVDESGEPWVCILAYAFDEKYNFYFISLPDAKHSQHINMNSSVSFSIYDSHQPFGKGVGLQIEGKAEVVNPAEYEKISRIYLGRKYPYGDINNDFMDGLVKMLDKRIYRYYRISATAVWINDPNADTDKRAKINL